MLSVFNAISLLKISFALLFFLLHITSILEIRWNSWFAILNSVLEIERQKHSVALIDDELYANRMKFSISIILVTIVLIICSNLSALNHTLSSIYYFLNKCRFFCVFFSSLKLIANNDQHYLEKRRESVNRQIYAKYERLEILFPW